MQDDNPIPSSPQSSETRITPDERRALEEVYLMAITRTAGRKMHTDEKRRFALVDSALSKIKEANS